MLSDMLRDLLRREDPLITRMRQIPFFQELKSREIREISKILNFRTFTAGETVFKQGQPGLGMYVMHSGLVEIVQEDEDETKMVLAEISGSSFFGELSLLDDSPCTASAFAVEESELALFSREDLLTFSEQKPHLGVKIMMQLSQIVAERLRRTNRGLRTAREEMERAQESEDSN